MSCGACGEKTKAGASAAIGACPSGMATTPAGTLEQLRSLIEDKLVSASRSHFSRFRLYIQLVSIGDPPSLSPRWSVQVRGEDATRSWLFAGPWAGDTVDEAVSKAIIGLVEELDQDAGGVR